MSDRSLKPDVFISNKWKHNAVNAILFFIICIWQLINYAANNNPVFIIIFSGCIVASLGSLGIAYKTYKNPIISIKKNSIILYGTSYNFNDITHTDLSSSATIEFTIKDSSPQTKTITIPLKRFNKKTARILHEKISKLAESQAK